MTVTGLFLKRKHGAPLEAVGSIACSGAAIVDNVRCAPFRQALIASKPVMADCGLKPGDLRENIIIDFDRLYDLPSGTVIKIGEATLRLTFHCEPCYKILKLIDFDNIVHRRGVFGSFLSAGRISVGDKMVVTEEKLEPIPYAVSERIRWHLKTRGGRATALDVVHAIGLPSSYARAMPRLVEKFFGARRQADFALDDQ